MFTGQRVGSPGARATCPGVIGAADHPAEKRSERGKVELTDLHIDIGASNREDAARLVRAGDAGVWDGEPFELPNDRFVSKSLDNRLGAYVALEAARRVAEAGDAQVDVVAVAAVQEELGLLRRADGGVLARARRRDRDRRHLRDRRAGRRSEAVGEDRARLGRRDRARADHHTGVADLLASVAEEEGIAHTFEVLTNRTHTDADAVHVSRAGVPTGLVSVPLRYMHSPGELGSLDDVEAVIALVVAFARRLDARHELPALASAAARRLPAR